MAQFNKEKIVDTLQRAVFKFTYYVDRLNGSAVSLTAGTLTGSIFWSDLSYGLSAATADTSRVDISRLYWSTSNAPAGVSGSTTPAIAVAWARPATAITGGNVSVYLSGSGEWNLGDVGMNLINPLTGASRLNQIDIYNATSSSSIDSGAYTLIIEVDKVSGFGITG